MILRKALRDCNYLKVNSGDSGDKNLTVDISGVAYDSRSIKEGFMFVAIKGEKCDGHDFIEDAIQKGAIAIVYEREVKDQLSAPIFIRVKNSRRALACVSNNFYERPSENMTLIGVTGTNGKTTTTYILKSILEAWGLNVGLIGTIQYMIKDSVLPAFHTTPEALEFQGLLSDMFSSGCTHVVSEISSHALAQFRVDSAVFRTAIFTNLTRDHLDFHKTMEDYFRAKERLFKELLAGDGTAVVNRDDAYGKILYSELMPTISGLNILTYGLQPGADIVASDIDSSFQGLRFKISFQDRIFDISSPLVGMINVYNILAAVGAALSLNIPQQVIIEGVRNAGNIAGRFEKVDLGQRFLCIVDYAHTEDALERLILTARDIIQESEVGSRKSEGNTKGRIIIVFGCGGDRDRGKRPKMGEAATRLSDFVIITSDNPRSEDCMNIIREIEGGVVSKNYLIEPDRKEAIRKAVEMANEGDIILIAGKGHEDYQEIRGVRYAFSDREVVKEAIKGLRKIPERSKGNE